MFILLVLCLIIDRTGGTDTRHDVFALCIYQPFPVELVIAGSRVTGKSDTRGRRITHIPKDHCLNGDGRAPIIRDLLNPAIGDSLLAIPALEDGGDATPELCHWIVREWFTEVFLD